MRTFFNDAGYLEVETPVLQPIPGDGCAKIQHITTRHSALYANSNELYLKIDCRRI
jgi:lysyl-tRNA synthetase class 2